MPLAANWESGPSRYFSFRARNQRAVHFFSAEMDGTHRVWQPRPGGAATVAKGRAKRPPSGAPCAVIFGALSEAAERVTSRSSRVGFIFGLD